MNLQKYYYRAGKLDLFFTLATYSICVQTDEITPCSSQQTLCTAWQIYSATAIESGCVIALKVYDNDG